MLVVCMYVFILFVVIVLYRYHISIRYNQMATVNAHRNRKNYDRNIGCFDMESDKSSKTIELRDDLPSKKKIAQHKLNNIEYQKPNSEKTRRKEKRPIEMDEKSAIVARLPHIKYE